MLRKTKVDSSAAIIFN